MYSKYKRTLNIETEEGNYWPSFTDLLSAILLFFLLFLIITNTIKNHKIEELEQVAQDVVDVRASLISKLQENFSDSGMKIIIDEETGAITFPDDKNVLFRTGQAAIRPQFIREPS